MWIDSRSSIASASGRGCGSLVYIDYVRRSRSSSCRLLRPINCQTYITLHYIWSKSVDSRGCNIWAFLPLSCPPPLRHIALLPTEMCGFQYFIPHPIQHLASAISSPSPRILNLRHTKNFQTCVLSAHKSVSPLLITSQSTDRASLKWLRQRYTDFMAAYGEGR